MSTFIYAFVHRCESCAITSAHFFCFRSGNFHRFFFIKFKYGFTSIIFPVAFHPCGNFNKSSHCLHIVNLYVYYVPEQDCAKPMCAIISICARLLCSLPCRYCHRQYNVVPLMLLPVVMTQFNNSVFLSLFPILPLPIFSCICTKAFCAAEFALCVFLLWRFAISLFRF